MNILAQIRVAIKHPGAVIAGAFLGAMVPVSTWTLLHLEGVVRDPWQFRGLVVLGGLVYSATTVYQWGKLAFVSGFKAFAFCGLVEGVMVTSTTPWLNAVALGYLVVINALATGCRLATADKLVPTNLPAVETRNRRVSKVSQSLKAVK